MASQPHLFLSYASADRDRAIAVADALESAGCPVWIDRRGIPGGAGWAEEITAALRSASVLVVLCSAASMSSRNVRQELQLAWDHGTAILPLLLEAVEFPDAVAYFLHGRQWIEVLDRQPSDWLPDALEALRSLGMDVLDSARAAAPTPVSAAIDLPSPLTALLGREGELAEIVALLIDGNHRLVTLVGPGGVGKTRLAIEVARNAVARFPDGAAFVDFAPVREVADVLPALAHELGVPETGGTTLAEALARWLRDQRRLLVLDNLEQVLAAAPDIAALLGRCSGLVSLATSRARLGVRGERVVPVAPLPTDPAVTLFVERARDADPDFALTGEHALLVAAICERLDRLPLAIELAAARVRMLSPAALSERLERALPVLTGGARDLPERQRTLHDTIAWSYDLLEPKAAALLRSLGIFAGGFDLRSAAAVSGLDPFETGDYLEALVDHSLVFRERGSEGRDPRFGLLETIREFALGQLRERGEHDAVAARHASYFADLVQRAERPLWDSAIGDTLRRYGLEGNQANIRVALGWLAANDPARHVHLTGVYSMVWYHYGQLVEGRRWLDGALAIAARLGEALPAAGHVNMLLGDGLIALMQGDLERAQAAYERARARADAAGDDWRAAIARTLLGGALVSDGRYDEAELLFEKTLPEWQALARAPGLEPWHVRGRQMWIGVVLFHLGLVAYARGDWDRSETQFNEAIARYTASGGEIETTDPLHYLALIACDRGDAGRAAELIADILERLRQRGSEPALADGLADVATLAAARGDFEASAFLFGAAARLLETGGGVYSLPARATYERAQETARRALGEEAWSSMGAEGRSWSLERALAEAEAQLAAAREGSA